MRIPSQVSRLQEPCYCGWLCRGGYTSAAARQVPGLCRSAGHVSQVTGTVLLCLAVLGAILAIVGTSPDPEQAGQMPQLDKSKDCVAVLGMFGAKAEQVTGTVLLCLAGQGWVYKCRS